MGKFNLQEIEKHPKQNLLRDPKKEKKKSTQKPKSKKAKTKMGRPVKNPEEKLSKKVSVNLTMTEYKILEKLAQENHDIALPKLIRSLLKEFKVF